MLDILFLSTGNKMKFKVTQELVSPNVIEVKLYKMVDFDWKRIPVSFNSVEEAKGYAKEYEELYVDEVFCVNSESEL